MANGTRTFTDIALERLALELREFRRSVAAAVEELLQDEDEEE